MYKILIKDTTREEREQLILESIEENEVSCGTGSVYEMYLPYINGEKELREINEERSGKYVVESDRYEHKGCGMG